MKMPDHLLISRIKKVLQGRPTGLSCESLAEILRDQHIEYKRKKFHPFKQCVERVCGSLYLEENSSLELDSYNVKDRSLNHSDSDKSFSDDNRTYTAYPDSNTMNTMLHGMYNKNRPVKKVHTGSQQPDLGKSLFIDTPGTKAKTETNVDRPRAGLPNLNNASCNTPEMSVEDDQSPQKGKKRKRVSQSAQIEGDGEGTSVKRKAVEFEPRQSTVSFNDIGGNKDLIKELSRLFTIIVSPDLMVSFDSTPERGFLLHGPSGCGKTLLANAIAGELEFPIISLSANEVVGGISGQSEERIRTIFAKAVESAPCVLFLDDIDSIAGKRGGSSREMDKRIVCQLCGCFDELQSKPDVIVLVVGATNRLDSIDPALRREGRFEKEIALCTPNEEARLSILDTMCIRSPKDGDLDLKRIAHLTPGFVGGDLRMLKKAATKLAVQRIVDQRIISMIAEKNEMVPTDIEVNQAAERLFYKSHPFSRYHTDYTTVLTTQDFLDALPTIQPSALREGFPTMPDVTFEDVGALEDVKKDLISNILDPIQYPEKFKRFGMTQPFGILMYGPPGCGKTLIAKAIANQAGLNFLSVEGPELLNMYQGESERAIRTVFERARNAKPCIIFFDEIDCMGATRSGNNESGSKSSIVTQLLTVMDGRSARQQVYILAATNRLDMIDPALRRPGRFDTEIYVPLPSREGRIDILKALSKNGTCPPFKDVNLEDIVSDPHSEHFSGADLYRLLYTACKAAMAEKVDYVHQRHLLTALSQVKCSVSKEERQRYRMMQKIDRGEDNNRPTARGEDNSQLTAK